MKTEIIYEDSEILVVYKPAGLATQTAKLGQADVVSELKGYLARAERESQKGERVQKAQRGSCGEPYLGVIHRLDQPVEGLLVFAKNKKAAGNLTAQLQRQGADVGLHKHYYAVLCGKPSQKEGELVDDMYKSHDYVAVIVEKPGEAGKGASAEKPGEAGKGASAGKPGEAKEARLRYRILAEVEAEDGLRCPGEKAVEDGFAGWKLQSCLALADIEIFTGRFHQIRAQMAHAGLPLLGDMKYGNREAGEAARAAGVRNVALCAYSLEFVHPVTGKKMKFQTEPKGIAFSLCRTHEK